MTIAAGFHCNEGIVLCADSQGTNGYIKGWTEKIRTSISQDFVISFALSGIVDYTEAAIEKAMDGIFDCKGFDQVRNHLEARLIEFFNTNLIRWPEHERPPLELLIGIAARSGGHGLFHYQGTAFHRVFNKAIGSGSLLADGLIEDYGWGFRTVEELSSMAIYILAKVKKHAEGCGGFTQLVALRRGGDHASPDFRDIEKLEREFEEQEKKTIAQLKAFIISKQLSPFKWEKAPEIGFS